jgi:nicotinamidase-related amidase
MRDSETALLLCDLQNDFMHTNGAYGRAGLAAPDITALAGRLQPLAEVARQRGIWVVATLFTLVPGPGGAPLIAPHLRRLRPFLAHGDFLPGGWGRQLLASLQPADATVEKIAYSAFYMSRLEWVLRHAGITRLVVGGIVTNGGVAATVRDALVREFSCVVLSGGCAAFTDSAHEAEIAALRAACRVATIEEMIAEFSS